ncbi:MAG: ELM1/GtrOC1 family putative glycosyltransferase [Alphaproteobacteria bacterium]
MFRWGDAPPNPYAGFLACADQVVVTGDSVSMLS